MSVSRASNASGATGLFSFIESGQSLNIPSPPRDGVSMTGRRRPLRIILKKIFKPQKRIAATPTVLQSIRAIVLASWLNILLAFVPVSWAINFATPDHHNLIFIFSLLSIIPLSKLLAFATDELSIRVGQTLAGLLNATMGNSVELIIAIVALAKCQLTIVRTSLVGAILSNILFTLGVLFCIGDLRFSEQGFGSIMSLLNLPLLTTSIITIVLPGALYNASTFSSLVNGEQQSNNDILKTNRGAAVIILTSYILYIAHQLLSSSTSYEDGIHISDSMVRVKSTRYRVRRRRHLSTEKDGPVEETTPGPSSTYTTDNPRRQDTEAQSLPATENEEEEEVPQLNGPVAFALLFVVLVFISVTVVFLIGSVDGVTSAGHINKEFIGLVLLPFVVNSVGPLTASTVSVKDRLHLSAGIAVGSSIQTALFSIPLVVIIGWGMNRPLTFPYDPLELVVLVLSVWMLNFSTQDGKVNWYQGANLMCTYLVVCVMFWFYPGFAGAFSSC
ncbi:hypothetical protein HYDPIDRAFT_26335 [Hydnomerulius pinastri MD-312]|nr:hypothetical protein HYDPIDRAFT_26335 [Hydnomerulius pinastri MD-312]